MFFSDLAFLVTLGFAACSDVSRRLVKNRLLVIGFTVQLILKLTVCPKALPLALLGMVLLVLLTLPLRRFHFFGGADIKLAALTLFYGPGEKGFRILYYSLLFASLYSVLILFKKPILKAVKTVLRLFPNLAAWLPGRLISAKKSTTESASGSGTRPSFSSGIQAAENTVSRSLRLTIPLAPCFLAGAALELWFSSFLS